jgi:hypothetical protein
LKCEWYFQWVARFPRFLLWIHLQSCIPWCLGWAVAQGTRV